MGQVEVDVVDPLRGAQVERMRAQHLPEPWRRNHSLGKARDERMMVRDRSSNDGQDADRKAYMRVRVLCLKEGHIKRCQVRHNNNVRRISVELGEAEVPKIEGLWAKSRKCGLAAQMLGFVAQMTPGLRPFWDYSVVFRYLDRTCPTVKLSQGFKSCRARLSVPVEK